MRYYIGVNKQTSLYKDCNSSFLCFLYCAGDKYLIEFITRNYAEEYRSLAQEKRNLKAFGDIIFYLTVFENHNAL